MNIKISKQEAEKEIDEFFKNIKGKSSAGVKKIKRLAMNKSIKLGERKKLFCKKCLTPYNNPKIRIKKGIKLVICENCNSISKWNIK